MKQLRSLITLDYRSLGVFRIALGILLLADLLMRLVDLEAHYTDDGLMPRSVLIQQVWIEGDISLHTLFGTSFFIAVLMGIQILFSLLIIFGIQSRISITLSWILLISLHSRNPLILSGGDTLLRLMLFWSIFLPLHHRFSLFLTSDLPKNESPHLGNYFSLGTMGFILQMICLYLCSGWLKNGEDWKHGMAVYYVLNLDMHITSIGQLIHQFREVEKILTYIVLNLERFGWLLLLIPWKLSFFRGVACILFMSMHLGFGLTLHLGLFPWLGLILWLPLIPGIFWTISIGKKIETGLNIFFERLRRVFSLESAREIMRILPVQTRTLIVQVQGSISILLTFICFCSIIILLGINGKSLGVNILPKALVKIARYVKLTQKWDLFAPDPIKNDGWYVIAAKVEGESHKELWLTREEFSWDPPEHIALSYRNNRWRKYLKNIKRKGYQHLKPYFGSYLCQKYSKEFQSLEEVRIFFMLETSQPPGELQKIERKFIWKEACE